MTPEEIAQEIMDSIDLRPSIQALEDADYVDLMDEISSRASENADAKREELFNRD